MANQDISSFSTISNHHDLGENSVAISGAGLVGCLLGVYLRKHGFKVTIFESRPDPRKAQEVGRSINLVMTSRGIHALTSLSPELAAKVMRITSRVEGRTLHSLEGETTYQSYGPTSSYCNFSVSRWKLNSVLMDAAQDAGCDILFSHPLAHVDIPQSTVYFYLRDSTASQLYQKSVKASHIFGADGGGSRCRQALRGLMREEGSDEGHPLGYGYKELTMPAAPSGGYVVHKDSLHIWPRGSHFLMGLSNGDGSFTMTLYMHEKGPVSFANLKTRGDVEAFFAEFYPSAAPLMPAYVDEFMANPVGFLGTVYCKPWTFEDKFCLIGDAAHAFTPFFGQGCNSGFEDVSVFHECLLKHTSEEAVDMGAAMAAFYTERKPNTDAIANMALENFDEMMSKTADKRFLLEKEIENELAVLHPEYTSRYALITHSLLPYHKCQAVGVVQSEMLAELSDGMSSIDELDKARAAQLVAEKLIPFLAEHEVTPDKCHYTSPYYEPAASA